MPRRLSDDNELVIQDNISGTTIVLKHRLPTTKERTGYANNSFQRSRNKVKSRVNETRLNYGLKILTGFRDGDFEIERDGKWVPIASESQSPNYVEDWKLQVKQYGADLVEVLAARVFEAPAEILDEDPEEDEDEPEELDPEDAEGN